MGLNKGYLVINELELQTEVNKIKAEHSETKAIYREVCMLLFFRYGVTPTANKLYQYVRKGSMSAPAEALNKFWAELRSKSRVQLDHPDLPEQLKTVTGSLVSKIWEEAQKSAQDNFSTIAKTYEDVAANAQLAAQKAEHALATCQASLEAELAEKADLLAQVGALNKRVADQEYLLKSREEALQTQHAAHEALKQSHAQLTNSMLVVKASFSRDLEAYTLSLTQAEDRYNEVRKQSMLEVDRNRQLTSKHQAEVKALKRSYDKAEKNHVRERLLLDKKVAALQEKLSMASGRYAELTKQMRSMKTELNKALSLIHISEPTRPY